MSEYAKKYGAAIARRDGGWLCHYCGCLLRPTDTPKGQNTLANHLPMATIDHVKPISEGGAEHDLANMVLSCMPCNHGRIGTEGRKPRRGDYLPKMWAATQLAATIPGKKRRARELKRRAGNRRLVRRGTT